MIRVVVVGAGQIARKVYLPVLAAMPEAELAVLVEPVEQRRQELNRAYRFGRTIASLDELSPGLADCALLLTPENVRREPVGRLLELGLDVLCEKPLAQSLPDAEALVELAQRRRQILAVGLNRRFMPVFRKAKEFLAGKRIDLLRVQKQGANLINHTIHMLDVMRFFCGEAVEVQAAGAFEGDKETAVAALIRFDSGTLGVFQTSAAVGRRLEEMEAHGQGFTVYVEAPLRVEIHQGGTSSGHRPDQETWYVQAEQAYGFTEEISQFFQAVRTRTPPPNHAADALKTHRLVFDILSQARQHARKP